MNDLIHRIVGIIIEAGQSDTKNFRLGETIRYTPSEIMEILKQHESEIFGEEPSTQPNASNTLNALDCVSRAQALNNIRSLYPEAPRINFMDNLTQWKKKYSQYMECEEVIKRLPPAQPELIEKTAYIRGFEQGRTQGMIDAQGGKNMIKAEWTNADALNLQPTCNQLATDCISRRAAIDALKERRTLYCDNTPASFSELSFANKSRVDELDTAIATLVNLPPAQPERDIPMKPNETIDTAWGIRKKQAVCPKCDYYLGHIEFIGNPNGKKITYCETCGQAIDWEGWEWEEE